MTTYLEVFGDSESILRSCRKCDILICCSRYGPIMYIENKSAIVFSRMTKHRRMSWRGHVARKCDIINVCKILLDVL